MKQIFTLLAIFSVTFLCQTRGTINPGMSLLYQHFNNYSMATVSLMTNICSLAIIPTSYIVGKNAGNKWKYKSIIIWMNIIMLIGGIGPYFVDNLYVMLFFRTLFGIGVGIAITLHRPLIITCYSGEKQLRYLGYDTIIASLGMIFFQTLVGILSGIEWKLMFLGYLPIILILGLSYFLPDIELKNETVTKESGKISREVKLIILVFLLLSIFTNCIGVNQATLFSLKKFSNPVFLTASVSNINAIFSVISGLFFNQIYQRFKNQFLIISLIISTFSISLFIFGTTELIMYIASALFGFAYNLVVLYLFLIPSKLVSSNKVAMIGGYLAVAAGIGGFLASLVMKICEYLFKEVVYSSFILCGLVFIICTIIIISLLNKKDLTFNRGKNGA